MKRRKSFAALVIAVALASASLTLSVRALYGQTPGFTRVPLQKHDLSTAGREAVQARGELAAGAASPRHTHPGEELAYILEGQITLEVEGKPPATLKAGDVFFVPPETAHIAKNLGTAPAKILSTYFVEKGKPLATPVPAPTAAAAKK